MIEWMKSKILFSLFFLWNQRRRECVDQTMIIKKKKTLFVAPLTRTVCVMASRICVACHLWIKNVANSRKKKSLTAMPCQRLPDEYRMCSLSRFELSILFVTYKEIGNWFKFFVRIENVPKVEAALLPNTTLFLARWWLISEWRYCHKSNVKQNRITAKIKIPKKKISK